MTFLQAITYLDGLKPVGMQMGLERIEHAVEVLGHPERAFRAVHIAGTNGKGSTARMLAAMLTANGHRTGLFTSPAVTGVRDMILIDGEPISEEDFAASIARVADAVPQGLSEYECLTAAVFCYFQEKAIDIAVVECCLGGKTDVTNVLPAPLCAVMTPIALDHTAILGNTIEEIARQKGGIIKPPCDIVCAPSMNEEALGVFFEIAAEKGLSVHLPSLEAPQAVDMNGIRFSFGDQTVALSLLGKHQQENAVTAITALQCLSRRGLSVDLQRSVKALSDLTVPCRLELISRNPVILLDGAHNPHGIEALCRTLQELALPPVTLVIGMLADKNTDACLRLLAPLCRKIICCTPPNTPRAMDASVLVSIAAEYHDDVQCISDPTQAFLSAKKAAGRSPIVIGGSFYTASAVRRTLIESFQAK